MATIVAIGGGELGELQTLPIDQRIVLLSGKKRPRVLFIPTASGDAEGYVEAFRNVYGRKLGCEVDVLRLVGGKTTAKTAALQVRMADIVYVGGGDTLRMLRLWKKYGVDEELRKAYRKGTILAGLSAGAIAWFRYGMSDSRRFSKGNDFAYIRVSGLDLVPLLVSPHHIRERKLREPALRDMMRRTPGVALAIDDNAALLIQDDWYEIVQSVAEAGIAKVFASKGNIVRYPIGSKGLLADLIRKDR
ncbi:MAG: peptidase E [Candidatus Moraniibacteriota bacterium]